MAIHVFVSTLGELLLWSWNCCCVYWAVVWSLNWLSFLNYTHKTHKAGEKCKWFKIAFSVFSLVLILSESFALFEVLFVTLVTLVGCLMTLMFMLSSLSHFNTDAYVQCPTEVDNDFRRSEASKAYKRCKACIKLSYVRDNLVPRSPRSCVVLCKCSVACHARRKVHWRSTNLSNYHLSDSFHRVLGLI